MPGADADTDQLTVSWWHLEKEMGYAEVEGSFCPEAGLSMMGRTEAAVAGMSFTMPERKEEERDCLAEMYEKI